VKSTSEFSSCDIILIEELQFFEDAFENVITWIEEDNKTIIAAGLHGDINRNMFGDVLRLLPYADTVTKVSALCKRCGDGTLAHFTKRISKDKEEVIVGGEELYESVCRRHFLS
jgi:thymidine kinase